MHITSRHNPKLREALGLRNRRNRDAAGEAIVDGVREIERAVAAGGSLLRMFVCGDLLADDERESLATLAKEAQADWLELDRDLFARLAYGDRDDGAVAIVKPAMRDLEALGIGDSPLIVVIEGVEKPGNLGAMLRSADGVGVDAVLVADPVIDLFNPNTIRASVATVFDRRVARCTAGDALLWLRKQQVPILAARPDAEIDYTQADFSRGGAIVVGNEAEGLTSEWHHGDVTPVRLPMRGIGDSLNVSVTAAILMYEARRQLAAVGANASPSPPDPQPPNAET